MDEDNRLIKERIEKVYKLQEKGINPYPYIFNVDSHANEILEKHSNLKEGEITKHTVKVAGRIMTLRLMGNATFAHLQDSTAQVQVYFSKDDLENYELIKSKLIELGDIIGVQGNVFKTKRGEISIHVKKLELLCKAVRPLPDKFHGITDTEIRYRQRYVDLIVNPEVRKVFELRSKIVNAVREVLNKRGFVESEIPVLQPIYGGANAKPFKTHINAWSQEMFLSISPELYLKRLIVGGFDRVYSICKNFRNEGVDKTHNPEFTMMECYQSYADYNDMMEITEEIYEHACKSILGTTKVKYQGIELNFKRPWARITMHDAIREYAGIDAERMTDEALIDFIEKNKVELKGEYIRGLAINAIFEHFCESKFIQPTFIMHHPKETTSLCKTLRGHPDLIERFEPFVNGWEIGNAYSELNDPIVQKRLFEEQAAKGRGGDEEAHQMDEDFIRALEYGMPPTGGLGLGIDRMVMLLTDAATIRDVILFPTMRHESKENK